ncbi:MAG: 2-amino-4-hydroxy-6-hydroxymethyldihydropteridine diphosphokinase [Gammaproteobacteria bacterium]
MARVFVGVGSNVDRQRHIRAGVQALQTLFTNVQVSTIYQNAAVGFAGEDFYNLVVAFTTDEDVTATYYLLRGIEDAHGRDRKQPRFSPRTLDLDLLLYDDLVMHNDLFQIPRDDIDKYAFVLKPLAELAVDIAHPVSGKTFAALWEAFNQSGQELKPVQSDWLTAPGE